MSLRLFFFFVIIGFMKQDNIKYLQNIVDETVRTLGGYWMPLSGLARVLEELGELGECMLKKDYGDTFQTELSDVLVIILCIGNQYCAKLDISTLEKQKNVSLEELYIKLVADCGEFARIVNSYEGNKKLKPTENPTTVEKQASIICLDIILIAQKRNLNITQLVKTTMLKVAKRDINRFDILYDPSHSLTHDEYIKSTKSNYKVWGLRESKGNTLEEDLQNNNDTITRFLKFGQVEGIDMLVIKIPHKEYHLENLGQYKHMLKTHIQKDFIVFTKK